METVEEELIADNEHPATDDLLKEAWPIPPEDYAREFEQYLLDIGVRI